MEAEFDPAREAVLKFLFERAGMVFEAHNVVKVTGFEVSKWQYIVLPMIAVGLISYAYPLPDHSVTITSEGIDAYIDGGWCAYLKGREAKKRIQQEMDSLLYKKLKNDHWLSYWQRKLFWPIFIGAITGGAYAVLQILSALHIIK